MEKTTRNYHKKTILQVLPSMISGGVERGTVDISAALVQNGYNSVVASNGGDMISQLYAHGAKHFHLPLQSKNPLTIWRNVSDLVQLIKDQKVNIIHARSRAPAWSAYYAAQKTGIKFVTTFHGTYNFNNSLKKYYNSIMAKGARVIAVSNFIKQHILDNYEVDEAKIRVIHRGVDMDYFNPENVKDDKKRQLWSKYGVFNKEPVILLPGRITEWKGQHVLVEALAKLSGLSFKALIVGDTNKHPSYVRRLQKLISQYNLDGKVKIFSTEKDMRTLYALADIILSTSIEPEAFGRIAVEGQAMEKIVIASAIGGACETVVDHVTGMLVEPGDAVALSAKLKYVIENLYAESLVRMRQEARQHIDKNFTLAKMAEETIKLYEELL